MKDFSQNYPVSVNEITLFHTQRSLAHLKCAHFHVTNTVKPDQEPTPEQEPRPDKDSSKSPERNYSIFSLRIETPCQQRPEIAFFLPKDHVSPVNKDHFHKIDISKSLC